MIKRVMNTSLQSAPRTENSFGFALAISGTIVVVLAALFFGILGVPLTAFFLFLITAALLWSAFHHPTIALGAVLACMPIYPVAMLLARFFGPSYIMSDVFKACDRGILLLLTCLLWWRNGIKLKYPDWFLLACFSLAAIRLAFGGMLLALLSDFTLVIAYAAGRVAVLKAAEEELWATRAVWIIAILSVLGMTEVFIFGQGPRTILYLSVADGGTVGGNLNATFHADGFAGLRESSTMFGPIQFASLCMVGLIVWWVYRRNVWLGVAIVLGLICSVTRSAWLGTALAIPILAFVMGERKRLFYCAGLVIALFIASIPVVGLGDYLSLSKRGQDLSAQSHEESVFSGVEYVLEHPLGSGPGNAGMYATKNNSNGIFIEDTYLTFAAEYGILTSLCFLGFLLSALWVVLGKHTQLGYAAVGILLGFGAVMMVAPTHQDSALASWVWFPIGLAVRSSEALQNHGGLS
jgi:hypothetical protein